MSFGFCLLHLWEWVLCRPKQFGLLSALWFADWQLSLLRLDVFYRSGFLGAELHTLSAIVFHQQNAMLFLHGRSPLLPSLPEQLPMPTMREQLLPQLHPQLHKLLIPYAWLHGLQLRTVPELRLRVLPREQLLHLCSMAVNYCSQCSLLNGNISCQVCLSGYYLSINFACVPCNTSVPFCILCANATACLSCLPGYVSSLTNKTC